MERGHQPSDDREISVICQACQHESKKSVDWLRRHTELRCRACGAFVILFSNNLRRREADDVE